MMMRVFAAVSFAMVFCASQAAQAFTLFESGPVRPFAMSPDGTRLFACNTPDDTLEVFDITVDGIVRVASIPVGLEPVAVAARSNTEVWVVNHLSDSVSVVDLTTLADARVVRTLHVGDEPRDIVFAGPGAQSRLHHDGSSRAEQPREPGPDHPRHGPCRRLGVRRDQSRLQHGR